MFGLYWLSGQSIRPSELYLGYKQQVQHLRFGVPEYSPQKICDGPASPPERVSMTLHWSLKRSQHLPSHDLAASGGFKQRRVVVTAVGAVIEQTR